ALSDDTLYFAIGDWSTEAVPDKQSQLVAQDPASAFGKTFGLDLATGKVTMRSLGHRNPEGMVLTADHQLLELEHGPEGGDELNRIEQGANYGWPYTVYGVEYGTFTWPIALKPPAGAKFTDAVYAFVPSIGSSSLIQVDHFSDRWAGDLLISSLKAQSLFRVHMGEGRVIYSEPIWIGTRIRDLVEMEGRIVMLTDTPSLIYMDIDQPRMTANTHTSKDLDSSLTSCMACHHLGPTNPTHAAPSLTNIVGRPIASDDFASYSAGLKAKGGRWDKEAIIRFIRDPGSFAPGSVMPAQKLTEEQARHIVEVLAN
ncbi:MAG: hypothetical protein JWM33_3885, partial [Caulobacteraceae bacterium]|nr:hypothetical protein [Caulobacteraceae bacterium]